MEAQAMLARIRELGRGIAKDYLEARRLYMLASAQGYVHAIVLLTQLEETIRTECPLLGKRVKVTGTSRADLNGRVGVARSFDEAKGRYVLELHRAGDIKASKKHSEIKPGNLIAHGNGRNGATWFETKETKGQANRPEKGEGELKYTRGSWG